MSPPEDDGVRTARGTGGRLAPLWQPGTSGNPLGGSISALGLAAQVRQRTGNGRELVEFFLRVLHGEPIPRPGHRPLTPDLDQRITAAHWLADRGYGRAKEIIELTNEASPSQRLELLRKLSDEDRVTLRAILTRALNGGSVPASNASDGRADGDPVIQEDDREIVLPDDGKPAIVPPDSLEPDAPPPPSETSS